MGAVAATTTLVDNVRARRWRAFDLQLFVYMLLLIAFGVVMGYSAGFAEQGAGAGFSQSVKTLIWTSIGLIIFFVAASVDYHWLQTLTVPIYALVLGLLTLTMLIGTNLFGAQMSISVAGLDFQFSEVSKVLMIVVLASFLSSRRERIGKLSTLVGAGLLMAVPTLLVFKQPDLGTALVFVAILIGMLFMSGASIGWMGVLAGATVAVAPVVVQSLADYQRQRLFCFLDPSADPQGACYQLVQALNAVGSGGVFGQGLTAGRQNQLGFLPVQSTDFIFTVVAEELGFVGSVVLLAIFALLIWRVLAIGWGSRDALGMMVATGLASMLLFQIMVNVGMVIGIMPVTGIPLPFVTYGGSSMISLLFGMGILQSVRMHARKPTF
ncbi:MAG TPA: rod shape-determining protein RodA [Candidatus Limnocylindria bacterium]|jgi:rod shape determining protein RodA|nr:rod shape-determining protein RodA [Candidatus Limnocylindria bacterium]